jgi:hypothetical protein
MSPSLGRVWNLDCRIVGGPPTKKPLPVISRQASASGRTGSAASLTALPVAVDGRPCKAGLVPKEAGAAKRLTNNNNCRAVARFGPPCDRAVRCTNMRLSMVKSAQAGCRPSRQTATLRGAISAASGRASAKADRRSNTQGAAVAVRVATLRGLHAMSRQRASRDPAARFAPGFGSDVGRIRAHLRGSATRHPSRHPGALQAPDRPVQMKLDRTASSPMVGIAPAANTQYQATLPPGRRLSLHARGTRPPRFT